MREKRWSEVFLAQGWAEALVIKGLLESNGIAVRLGYEALGSILGLTTDGLGEVKIMVPREKAEEARALMASSSKEDEGQQ